MILVSILLMVAFTILLGFQGPLNAAMGIWVTSISLLFGWPIYKFVRGRLISRFW